MTDQRSAREKDAAITARFADLEVERDELESRIESLVGEREELREALSCPAGCGCVFPASPDQRECACDGLCTTYDWQDFARALTPTTQDPMREDVT